MPAKEIKALRQEGKLDEAYAMAQAELASDPNNIWPKRNLSWVLYAQLDTAASDLDSFLAKITEVVQLALPESEDMFFENISIVISKAARALTKGDVVDTDGLYKLFDAIKGLPLKRNAKWFSVLFEAFHRGFKNTDRYIEFVDWWGLENFKPEDYQKEKLQNGREIMSRVEQAYIAYAKQLLPRHTPQGELIADAEKIHSFLVHLDNIIEKHPEYEYPPYYKAKLLLAIGDKENSFSAILPFARRHVTKFWVWDVLSEAFPDDEEKQIACYSKALNCQGSDDFLIRIRQKLAAWFVAHQMFDEAKTEVEQVVAVRTTHDWKIPSEIQAWRLQPWYNNAIAKRSNIDFYKKQFDIAEDILFFDIPEETIIVEFVNSDRKIVNFIASEEKYGFFKYDRFISRLAIGDVLSVRFKDSNSEGLYKILSLKKVVNEDFRNRFIRNIDGKVRIPEGKTFGFLEDNFVHPSLVKKFHLKNEAVLKGKAIKAYNPEKKSFGWKVFELGDK